MYQPLRDTDVLRCLAWAEQEPARVEAPSFGNSSRRDCASSRRLIAWLDAYQALSAKKSWTQLERDARRDWPPILAIVACVYVPWHALSCIDRYLI